MTFTRKLLACVMGINLLLVSLLGGCFAEEFAPPPHIPVAYYDCVEVFPITLVNAYFSGYGEIWRPIEAYNGLVFVFKNHLLDGWTLSEVDEGWLWLDYIKCYLANPEDMRYFELGDRVDVVGLNIGPEDVNVKQLTFVDCYVLPPGLLALPASGDNGFVVGGY